jgi:hypothetical protein
MGAHPSCTIFNMPDLNTIFLFTKRNYTMRAIRVLALCGVFFLVAHTAFAQLPTNKYKIGKPFKEHMTALRNAHNGFSFLLRYNHIDFLNKTYSQNIGQRYRQVYGTYWGCRLTAFPFHFDMAYNTAIFDKVQIAGIATGEGIKHRAGDFAISTSLLPTGKIAKYIQPTIGVGYQASELCGHCTTTEEDDNDLEVPLNRLPTSSAFWKTGLTLTIYKSLRFEGEYKQTLSLNNRYAMRGWSAGITLLLSSRANG